MNTTSPKATACSTLPLRAFDPTASAAFFATSASRSENMISWPDLAQSAPNVEPMRPEPMMPIFVALPCANAEGTSVATVAAKRNARRFIQILL